MAGVANQSETNSHISYCVTAKSHIVHVGTREHHPISFARACMCLRKSPSTQYVCKSHLDFQDEKLVKKICDLYTNKYGIYVTAA